ncbi:hypothetical protein [Methylibium sp.]|uniref:hypothetical protein n=1 Tax=Methylibium sp. TaxID=2067992 RepID=UPI003D0ABAE3
MTTALLLFASTFVAVFALVLQSLNVNGGHRVLACITSFFITGSNLVLFKTLPGDTHWLQIAAHMLGGAVAVLAGMAAHPYLAARMGGRPRPAATTPHVPPIFSHPPDPLLEAAQSFARRVLDPEDLGHLANAEIRDAARDALGLPRSGKRP